MRYVSFIANCAASDWSQFWPSLVATLIGFVLAIVFQQIVYEKIKAVLFESNKAKKLLAEIKKELNDVCATLHRHGKEISDAENGKYAMFYVDPIKTPLFDGMLNENAFPYLTKYKKARLSRNYLKSVNRDGLKRTRINVYNLILSVYDTIRDYNKWWNIYSESWASGNDSKRMKDVANAIDSMEKNLCSKEPDLTDEEQCRELKCNAYVLSQIIDCVLGNSGQYSAKAEWIQELAEAEEK